MQLGSLKISDDISLEKHKYTNYAQINVINIIVNVLQDFLL